MKARMLIGAGALALGLGLGTAAWAQGTPGTPAQPGMSTNMQPGTAMGADDMQAQKPMKRKRMSKRMSKKSMKKHAM